MNTTKEKKIIFLDDDEAKDFTQVGSKAGRLALARQSGLIAPDGFVVTTSAFEHFLQSSTPLTQLQKRVGLLDLESMTDHHFFYAEAVEHFTTTPLAPELQLSIEKAYQQLSQNGDLLKVAVRSSAVAEDLKDASFAGQYETILNVQGHDELLKGLRTCWASLWTRRSLHYAMWHNVPLADLRMAVFVQVMAPAKFAGVLFTRSPDSSQKGMLVEAVAGLGEQLVSGKVTPSRYHLPVSGEITSNNDFTPLHAQDLVALRALGEEIEQLFGEGQDVEWVIGEKEGLSLVQVRPATTPEEESVQTAAQLKEDAQKSTLDDVAGSWSRDLVGEWFRSPITPLFGSVALPPMSTRMFALLEEHFGLEVSQPCWKLQHGYVYFRADVRGLLWSILRLPLTLWRGVKTVEPQWKAEFLPLYQEKLSKEKELTLEVLSDDELLETIDRLATLIAEAFAWTIFTGVYAFGAEWLLRVWWRIRHPLQGKLSYISLLENLENTTQEANRAFMVLVSELQNSAVPILDAFEAKDDNEPLISACNKWLKQYGHRVNDLDILEPTMQEDPIQLIFMLQGFSRQNPISGGEEKKARKKEKRAKRGGWLARIRQYYAIREDRPFYLHQGWPLMRRAVLEAGRRLVRKGKLDYANDVVFLTYEELRLSMNGRLEGDVLRRDIGIRRQQWLQARRITPTPQLNPLWWQQLVSYIKRCSSSRRKGSTSSQQRHGIPGSPGQVTAPARCIRGPEEFAHLKPGEILVAPATTPAWTPLFVQAVGLITEQGGALSHGAIVSREYGIPAVLGVEGILDELTDGMIVKLDGETGEVQIQ